MWNPRTCGEKTGDSGQPEYVQGSPPRGRGKECVVVWVMAKVGIAPAQAGKRSSRSTLTASPTDHPRIGGEKLAT